MGWKCGNCNVDFAARRDVVEHMIGVHNSPFLDSGEEMRRASKNAVARLPDGEKKAALLKAHKDAEE